MIVEDINNTDVVGPNTIVGALAATCAECLSTPNAGQLANKVNAQSDYNDRPRDKPKNRTNGFSGSRKPQRPTGPQEWHRTAKCHGCGEVGHTKPVCPNKNKTDAKTGSKDSPVPISSAKVKELASRNNGEEGPQRQRRRFGHGVWGYRGTARTTRSSVWHKARAGGSGTCSTMLQAREIERATDPQNRGLLEALVGDLEAE